MVVHTILDSVSCTTAAAGSIPAFPGYIGAANQATSGTSSVSGANATPAAGLYTRYTYEYVNLDGTVVDRTAATAQNFVRYCEFPGERLFKNVKFEVNGNPLDEYTAEAMIFHQKFKVAPGKLTGWKRLVGQEVPVDAYSDLCAISGASAFPAEANGLLISGAAAPVAARNAADTCRELGKVVNGAQTPKATQPALDMWIPLLFWFNKDARLSIPSVSIPYGQRFITIELEAQDKIVFPAAGNLFLQLTVERFANSNGQATGTAITNYRRYVTREPVVVPNSTVSTSQGVNTIELYINNIFVNPEIHDIYIKRIGFSLIRVYRFQRITVNTPQGEQLLSQLKWPIETIYAGLRPQFNITKPSYSGLAVSSGNANTHRDWHRLTKLDDAVCEQLSRAGSLLPTNNADPTAIDAASAQSQTSQWSSKRLTYTLSTKTIKTVKITAHGIPIFNDFNAEFFSNYMPYQYGGYNVITPEDEGALMINFCLYPGTYQPSGGPTRFGRCMDQNSMQVAVNA